MNKYLVYTSAGDQSNIAPWLAGSPNFDLYVSYYGNTPGTLADVATYYQERKGGKFPNLYHEWVAYPERFSGYSAIMVMDDDIQIDTAGINRVFALREKYNLWCCQPAFNSQGHVSHDITRGDSRNILRYTNFVEVTCPVFRTDVLTSFMRVYDPVLVGWGVDWWFLHHMQQLTNDLEGKVAVIDEITCANPPNRPNGGREIDALQSTQDRFSTWQKIRQQKGININERHFVEFSRLRY
ncbi:MAG: hypothetical protein V7711_01185 [Pseudomonadales bacterium]